MAIQTQVESVIDQCKPAYALSLTSLRQSGLEVIDPTESCRACNGRGYEGWNVIHNSIELCRCIFKNKRQYNKIKLNTFNRDRVRQALRIQSTRGYGSVNRYISKIIKRRRYKKKWGSYVK